MSPTLTVIFWRDIPAQVMAKRGRETVRRQLPDRFQAAIDRAAMRAGLGGTDAYLAEWRRESRTCGDDLEAEVAAVAHRLESEHPPEVLRRLVAAKGLQTVESQQEAP